MTGFKAFLMAAALVAMPGMALAKAPAATSPALADAVTPREPGATNPPADAVQATPAPGAAAPAAATEDMGGASTAGTATPQFYKPEPGIGQPDGRIGIQDQFTTIGQDAAWMHDAILMPVITAICLLVLALLLWVVIRYRRAANPVPSRTSHNTLIEVLWTVIPVIILVIIAVPSIRLLAAQYSPPKADLTVKVIGHQWYWSYQYPDNGDFEIVSNMLPDEEAKRRGEPRLLGVDERMVVPVGAVVKLIVTSDDVIHSFGLPAFWQKTDAVPGRLNESWFKAERTGVFYGQCSELCGARHAYMPIAVEVVTPAQFAQWVAAKGGTIGGSGGAPAAESGDATATSPITNPTGEASTPADAATAGATPAPAIPASGTAVPTSQGSTKGSN